MNFGEKLKLLRQRMGKSQAKVAEEISEMFPSFSISQTYLSALESKSSAPREEILDILSEYFGVPIQWLLSTSDSSELDKNRENKLSAAEAWIDSIRSTSKKADNTKRLFARAEGFQKDDDEIKRSLDTMREILDDDDEFLDF